MRSCFRLISAACAALLLAAAVCAQVVPPPPPFSMKIQQTNSVQVVTDGATLTMAADGVGLPSNASITVTYTNITPGAQATLNSITLTGSTDFNLPNSPPTPLTL